MASVAEVSKGHACQIEQAQPELQSSNDDRAIEECDHVHYSHGSGWLRAAVLGANDGLVSVASLLMGVSAAGSSSHAVSMAVLQHELNSFQQVGILRSP